jgi:hypothetical protein
MIGGDAVDTGQRALGVADRRAQTQYAPLAAVLECGAFETALAGELGDLVVPPRRFSASISSFIVVPVPRLTACPSVCVFELFGCYPRMIQEKRPHFPSRTDVNHSAYGTSREFRQSVAVKSVRHARTAAFLWRSLRAACFRGSRHRRPACLPASSSVPATGSEIYRVSIHVDSQNGSHWRIVPTGIGASLPAADQNLTAWIERP